MRKWLLVLAGMAVLAAAGLVAACSVHERGYLSPQFSPDGASVVVVVRETRAIVFGLGYPSLTPPARSRVLRDRFSIVRIGVADRRLEVLHAFPPSPIEGTSFASYRPSLAGSASAHLRWASPEAIEYEISVSRPRQPSSETFLTSRRWRGNAFVETPWTPGSGGMGGAARSQLHGRREVVALRAAGALPCAVLIITEGEPLAMPLIETPDCRKAYPDGYPVAALTDIIRRPDLERADHLRDTHHRLMAEARAGGLSESDAAMAAIRGMQQLGLYPKPSTLVATRVAEAVPDEEVFEVAPVEFLVGLFPDIRAALDAPGEEVEKSTSPYIVHRDYDTSRRLNAYLDGRRRSTFFVRADGALWRMEVAWR